MIWKKGKVYDSLKKTITELSNNYFPQDKPQVNFVTTRMYL